MAKDEEEIFGEEEEDIDEEILIDEEEEEDEVWSWEEADNGGGDDRNLIPITDVIGKVITVEGFVSREGTYGTYLSVMIKENKVFNTGSTHLMPKLQRANRLGKFPAKLVIGSMDLDGGRILYQFHMPKKGDKPYK